jgi:N-acetylglucosaminyldiphosphoundecaprenol N-acetyl-beta-D-mannosaminyltransferase
VTKPLLARATDLPVPASPIVELFGLKFSAVTLEQAADLLLRDGANRTRGLVITPNVDHVVLISKNDRLRAIYQHARWLFADGMPIVWLSRLRGHPRLPARVTGADLFVRLCAKAAGTNLRLFFLGAAPGVAATAASAVEAACPGLKIAGVYSPPIGFDDSVVETRRIIELCNAARPDVLFLGLGTPKQEFWAAANMDRLDVGPILCVGGAFDFVAGRTVRAPRLVQTVGMEWAWRLAHEPKRLWKRYLVRDSRFIGLAVREAITALRHR